MIVRIINYQRKNVKHPTIKTYHSIKSRQPTGIHVQPSNHLYRIRIPSSRHFEKWSPTRIGSTSIEHDGPRHIQEAHASSKVSSMEPKDHEDRCEPYRSFFIEHSCTEGVRSCPYRARHSPSARLHTFTDTDPHPQAATTIPPANAVVASTTASIASMSCRVNVPCVTPCSSFVASANIFRGRRVLCGASRREDRRRRGDRDGKPAFNAVELAHAQGRTRSKRDKTKESRAEQRRDGRREEAARTRDRRLVDAYSFDWLVSLW